MTTTPPEHLLAPAEIEAMAVEHEAFGFGKVGARGLTTHGFDPEGLASFVGAIERALLAKLREQQPLMYVESNAPNLVQCSPGAMVLVGAREPRDGFDTPLYAAPVPTPAAQAAQAAPAVTEDDAYGLIGQAVLLREQGKHDIPAWFFDLAARIFLTLGNQHGYARCRQMAAAPTPTGAGDEGGAR